MITADEEMGAGVGRPVALRGAPRRGAQPTSSSTRAAARRSSSTARRFYTLCVGEKGVNRFLLRARGVAGHASVPALGENALLKLAPALERLREQPPLEPTEEGIAFLAALLGDGARGRRTAPSSRARSSGCAALSPPLAAYLAEPMLRVTMVPTTGAAPRDKDNVIPSQRRGAGRLPRAARAAAPDEAASARRRSCSGRSPTGSRSSSPSGSIGNSSPAQSPLADAIAAWLAEADPDATLVPIVMPGFSDSHWFRKAFDAATVYGFCPQRELGLFEAAPLIHGADERAAVADVELAAGFYADLCRRVLG